MTISRATEHELLDLLRPHMRTAGERQAYLQRALGMDSAVLDRLVLTGAVNDFIPEMVIKLVRFGEISPGQPALCALLEEISKDVGIDQQEIIDRLLQQIRQELNNTQPNPSSKQEDNLQKERSKFLKKFDYFLTNQFNIIQLRNEISLQLKKLNLIQPNDKYDFYESSNDIDTIPALFSEKLPVRWILGEPGVGKTTALLKLAEIYYQNAINNVNNVNFNLPAYFDLSRWNNKEESLSLYDWLIKELRTNYRINKRLAQSLLEEEHMILFLDGLNEVKERHQSDCVREISNFIDQYSDTHIVVSCRRQDYVNIINKLLINKLLINKLLNLVQTTYFQVQPLQEEQIKDYLASHGQKGRALQQVLQHNNLLQDLARTPLMLNIMTQLEIKNVSSTGDLEQGRQELIDAYVKQSFQNFRQRPIRPWLRWLKYDEYEVKRWLKWLAQHMESSTFLIEEMQPKCLDQSQKKTYRNLVFWWNCIFFGLLFGAAYGAILHYYILHLSPQTESSLEKGLLFGIIQGFISTSVVNYYQNYHEKKIEIYVPLNKFSIKKYWQEIIKNISSIITIRSVIGIGISIFFGCLAIMPTIFQYKLTEAVTIGLIWGPFFGIVTLVSWSINASFVRESNTNETAKPNQGIRDLFNLALKITIISAFSIYIVYTIIIFFIDKIDLIMLIIGLCFSLITGLVASLAHSSGRSYMFHYTLRLVLVRYDCIPIDYVRFLEYARELTFMKRIGGGYQFYHQEFKEYFQSIPINETEEQIS
ncbi:NACHT domain-containing protein [Moorena sp. SIO4G3]|uniref:NACHT domain-containing protein n=1 Tax=Moorena sp. SIO4G3 TaxID=2607821 RepID=UPI00142B26AB|nr:NACHT domain-containing protein [Moorena sp. SIO4G3]NEO80607.1 NACHT domain-containing protein [Moorena sp. SIO4G3]